MWVMAAVRSHSCPSSLEGKKLIPAPEQGVEEPRRLERLLHMRHVAEAVRDGGAAVAGGEDERDAGFAEPVGDREGHLAPQIDVEDRAVDLLLIDEPQGVV